MKDNLFSQRSLTLLGVCVLFLVGVFLRFYRITDNTFFFYDEGLWLAHNIEFLYFLDARPPASLAEIYQALRIMFRMALSDAKALWFFICSLRVFFVGAEGYHFTRLVSAVSGVLTVGVTYLFAKRYLRSQTAAVLSLLAILFLPSHVFYSRLGMQESLSVLLFVLGLYLYLFPRRMGIRTFLAGGVFAAVFLVNYRMIIIPVILAAVEIIDSLSRKEKFGGRRYVWCVLSFLSVIFLVGDMYDGSNTRITFAWMFRQAQLAGGTEFDILNFASFPYYTFRLESILFGAAFWGNLYFFYRRRFDLLVPFGVCLLTMLIFSLSQDKSARYTAVTLPFLAMSVSAVFAEFWYKKRAHLKFIVRGLFCLMVLVHVQKAYAIVHYHEDYSTVVRDLKKDNSAPRVVATQPLVLKLHTQKRENAIAAPHAWPYLAAMYQQGFRYLAVGPQAYVSYTQDQRHFSRPLIGYLNFIERVVTPEATYPHFNEGIFERFVFEHNSNLNRSLEFIRDNEGEGFHSLKVYDLRKCLLAIREMSVLLNRNP